MRVLIVEDEDKIARLLKRGLKEEGYAPDVASDGEKGFFLATTNEYDVIILDIMLPGPGPDGITLCQRLREKKIEAPIIMVTAKDDVSDKVRGLDAGANDYITKPFAFEELLARIRTLLRSRVSFQPATKLQTADLTVDLLAHKVTRQGKEIFLTAKEYALLEYLMRNAGSVVTRTMVLEHVWDMNFDTDTNIVDVYINYLRRKIDDGFKKELIQTMRGTGYTLRP